MKKQAAKFRLDNSVSPEVSVELERIQTHESKRGSQSNASKANDESTKTDDVNASSTHVNPQIAHDDTESDDEIIDVSDTNCQKFVATIQHQVSSWLISHRVIVYGILYVTLVAGYAVYFGFAMNYSFGDEASIRLLAVTAVVLALVLLTWLNSKFDIFERLDECMKPVEFFFIKYYNITKWTFISLVMVAVVLILVLEVGLRDPANLVSLSGIIVYILLFYIFSKNPAKVRWRPVLWGLGLQFIFALLILRTAWGYATFEWLGDRVSEFLAHSDAGEVFVFGEKYTDHPFAFKVLPVIVFFSATISVLYYLGIMQIIIGKIAWVMQVVMGTTAAESVNAAANIFVSQGEAPLMIRPLIQDMTRSELHAVCTGGFATIAGSVMAAYIEFGVPANHLLSASVMSAPAALAMAKLFWPETQVSKTTAQDVQNMGKSNESNILEAASNGASASIKLVANIAVNLIAFVALLDFVNATLMWMGERVGYPYLSFEGICSYVLWPFAFVMGVDFKDCRSVAGLIGIKTSLNEFVAFAALSKLIENRKTYMKYIATPGNRTVEYIMDDVYLVGWNKTLTGGFMSLRSETISTYALCGFSNFSSIGIMLGALGAMAPQRKHDISKVVFRAMIAGNVACFMTACIAGLLFDADLDKDESNIVGMITSQT